MKVIALAMSLVLLGQVADAAVVTWSASLAPENEVPPQLNAPLGATGSATGTLETDTNLLSWDVSWTGLSGVAVGAHFHGPATTTQNAGVVVNIGAISGLDSPSAGSTTIDDNVEQALLGGLLYINVHTQLNPGGEVRGQVVPAPIPVPATLPLLLASAGVLLALGRRRT